MTSSNDANSEALPPQLMAAVKAVSDKVMNASLLESDLVGLVRDALAFARSTRPRSGMTVSEINDTLDLAECAVHDKIHNPNERDWIKDNLQKLRAFALSETGRGDTAKDDVSIPRDLADDLLAYGMVHTCNGVVYRKPHMERLRELDALLRSNGGCTEKPNAGNNFCRTCGCHFPPDDEDRACRTWEECQEAQAPQSARAAIIEECARLAASKLAGLPHYRMEVPAAIRSLASTAKKET